MRGTVEAISVKAGTNSKGEWKKTAVKVGEVWYSTFDTKIGSQLKKGDTYDFEIEEGQYPTIKAVMPVAKVAEATPQIDETLSSPPESVPHHSAPQTAKEKDAQIARAVALKAAVETAAYYTEKSISQIICVAEEYEAWLTR